jgi:hypothetical protein
MDKQNKKKRRSAAMLVLGQQDQVVNETRSRRTRVEMQPNQNKAEIKSTKSFKSAASVQMPHKLEKSIRIQDRLDKEIEAQNAQRRIFRK